MTGLCNGGCAEGWYGNCSQQCSGHCRNGDTCNHVTGQCDRECAAGWTGLQCEKGVTITRIFTKQFEPFKEMAK